MKILAFKKKERKQIPNKTSYKTLIVIKTITAKVGIVHCKVVNVEFAKHREHAAYIISLILTITNQKFRKRRLDVNELKKKVETTENSV